MEDKIVIAKCGHEVRAITGETDYEFIPDCCAMCEELVEARILDDNDIPF